MTIKWFLLLIKENHTKLPDIGCAMKDLLLPYCLKTPQCLCHCHPHHLHPARQQVHTKFENNNIYLGNNL